ncbi:MAG: hypothetical protein OEV44_04725 [Spirochaetota bacterium]|nr:hypothetical protein [Spirochaetota bacterium]
MKIKKLHNLFLFSFIVFSFITSCVIMPEGQKEEVKDLKSIKKDEVIIVGRIVLDPPLTKKEREYSGHLKTLSDFENKASFSCFNVKPSKDKTIVEQNSKTDGYFYAQLGKPFYIKSSNRTFYIGGGNIRSSTLSINLPARFKVNVERNDKAIYVGTIIYRRDDFDSITKIEFVDEYDKIKRKFHKKFGNNIDLRKSLLQAVK